MAEVMKAPSLAGRSHAADDRVAIDENLDGPHVAGEVVGIGIGLGETRRLDASVVLSALRRTMA